MMNRKDFKEVETLMSELMRISACNEAGDKLVIELQAKIAHLEAERDALRKGAEKTIQAIAILHDGPDASDVEMAEGMLTEAIGIFRAAIAAKEIRNERER